MNKNRLKMGRLTSFWHGVHAHPRGDVADGETAARDAMPVTDTGADEEGAWPPRSIITISMEIFIVTVLVFFWL